MYPFLQPVEHGTVLIVSTAMTPRKQVKLDEGGLWDYALRILSRKSYSAGEIKQKLSFRAAPGTDISAVLTKLRDYGFADDEKFSETFAQARLRNEGFGRSRVLRDLRTKKVSAKVAEQAIEKTFAGTSEAELIDNFMARKYRLKDLTVFLKEEKNLASAYRKLRLAGFSSNGSLQALKRHAKHVADFEVGDEAEEEG
jgi:regulatory protein